MKIKLEFSTETQKDAEALQILAEHYGVLPTPPPPKEPDTPATLPLHVEGNRILRSDGTRFSGRGVNIFDTRSCNACTWAPPNVDEVKRRIKFAIDMGCIFLRLCLESYEESGGRVHYLGMDQDATYRAHVREIVEYIGTFRGVYVLVIPWQDPMFGDLGWPDADAPIWTHLADIARGKPHVLIGLCNEPRRNWDGAGDGALANIYQTIINGLRADGVDNIIVAQGTRAWARQTHYFVERPLHGTDIAYEAHIYDPVEDYDALLSPAGTIPLIVGEFGPSSYSDVEAQRSLMDKLRGMGIPWTAWALHPRCDPSMLVDNSNGGCGVGMPLMLTPWGNAVKEFI